MRDLNEQESIQVFGANNDNMFDGFIIGTAIGTVLGAGLAVYYVSHKYPLLSLFHGTLENAATVGGVGGGCIGAVFGTTLGYIWDNT
ncbi:MAG: hypothetical protein JSR17_05155 [Proteobacteria bacterium]|nr:hypothetical protein [Pseudomonadota bacterium]